MTNAAIATKVHQTLDVHRNLATQVAFDFELRDFRSQVCNLWLGQILNDRIRRNARLAANLLRASISNAVNRRQCNHDVLV
jgi:hypothetical protein